MLGNLQMKKIALAVSTLALLGASACGDSKSDGGGNGDGDMAACGLDSGNTAASATTGSITGKISVAAGTKATAGDLFVAVLPSFDPSTSCPGKGTPPTPAANLLARCVDLGDGAYSYTINGVPPRADKYYVIPFMDTNANVDVNDPANAGPDACDLISTGVQVVVDKAGATVKADDIEVAPADILVAFCMLPECAE